MISGVNHITLTVHDIDIAFNFYTTVLGMKPIMKSRQSAYFQAGNIWIAIVKGERRDDKRYDHIAWQVSKEDFNKISEKIIMYGSEIWKENDTEGESLYFLDPSGNKFELHYSTLDDRVKHGKVSWGRDIIWYI